MDCKNGFNFYDVIPESSSGQALGLSTSLETKASSARFLVERFTPELSRREPGIQARWLGKLRCTGSLLSGKNKKVEKVAIKKKSVAIFTMSSSRKRGSRPDGVTVRMMYTKEDDLGYIKFIENITEFFRKENFIESSTGYTYAYPGLQAWQALVHRLDPSAEAGMTSCVIVACVTRKSFKFYEVIPVLREVQTVAAFDAFSYEQGAKRHVEGRDPVKGYKDK